VTARGAAQSLRLRCVRHAPTDTAGVAIGRTDVATIASPAEAARRIDEALPRDVAILWSSPSRRCAEPAALVAAARGLAHRIDPALHELHHGTFEGRRYLDIEREEPAAFEAWMAGWLERGPPGGEGARDLEVRVGAWLRMRALDPERALGIVAHAGVVRALRVIVERRSWGEALRDPVPHLERIDFTLPQKGDGPR
jgi:alpha-ribazole phosphatase